MKSICIYHSRDLDGWMSAAIVKKWFLQQPKERENIIIDLDYKENNMQGSHYKDNVLYMKGWDYGDKIPDLSEYDKVIMCDVSFKDKTNTPYKPMLNLITKLNSNFIWIDHHQSTINEIVDYLLANNETEPSGYRTKKGQKEAACELTWQYFFHN